MTKLVVVGGGLAGSEAAWQAAERGLDVELYEMRPEKQTGAHTTGQLAELVCSNSLGSQLEDRASGLLNRELKQLGSMLLECAGKSAVPAGGALAVDRDAFARGVTERIQNHPRIRLVREEVTHLPGGPCVIASGPLTSPSLSEALAELAGREHLAFFDAISPIVLAESLDMGRIYRASRYLPGEGDEGDYLNCPLDRDQYYAFVAALTQAERIPLRDFEEAVVTGVKAGRFFEGCLPIEILASRGPDALAYGPMRPVGLNDPRTGHRPYAVVQLRQDNLAGSLYNIVGFQTNLKYPEQKRVFRMIPGLESAEFARYGQMHRNTFIASPELLLPTLQLKNRPEFFIAGQLTGVEGYLGNIATGLLAGMNAARIVDGREPLTLPETTMLGGLCHYITHASLKDFQPMKANYGILPPLEAARRIGKRERARLYGERAMADLSHVTETIAA